MDKLYVEEKQTFHESMELKKDRTMVCVGVWVLVMRIVSWNIRGLGFKSNEVVLKYFLLKENLEIVTLQGTKKQWCVRLPVEES